MIAFSVKGVGRVESLGDEIARPVVQLSACTRELENFGEHHGEAGQKVKTNASEALTGQSREEGDQ